MIFFRYTMSTGKGKLYYEGWTTFKLKGVYQKNEGLKGAKQDILSCVALNHLTVMYI